ncbi:hypothetical protein F183_A31860 [Bryobacterales bacterium F-183]|nr:hypothetical protein F183_A31860 [Bryobacterales bacterium F-183]
MVLTAAPTIRLYLKDGEFHVVREYQVLGDRVKFYSVERGDWEEIPLDLVDLKKTKSTIEQNEAETKKLVDAEREEVAAEREAQREVASVPAEPGVYWINGKTLEALTVAEVNYAVDKKRRVLKALSPIPMVAGKAVLEIDGETSARIIPEERPEFYFRLAREERLAIIRLNPGQGKDKKKTRIVEKIQIVPVVNELVEELDEVESFRRQVGDLLFKIWPTKPLVPGEYALIEYSPAVDGKYSLQVWDFSVRK